jgi:Holliday junction resolvase
MNYQSKKGTAKERELIKLLAAYNYAVMRALASGGGTTRELPDVLAGNGDVCLAIEAKSSSKEVIYIGEEEIIDLYYFAWKYKSVPLVGVRFNIEPGDPAYGDKSNPGWYFFQPHTLYRTPKAGNYRVKKDVAIESGLTLDELVQLTSSDFN